jgi:NAD(P)-dependent dehydrogenase (short-subunit alcohol dehydrogenase family)
MRAAVARVVQAFGGIDIAIANAGINGIQAPIDEITPEEWDETINTNLRGSFLTLNRRLFPCRPRARNPDLR